VVDVRGGGPGAVNTDMLSVMHAAGLWTS
jgi:hypothetical protein